MAGTFLATGCAGPRRGPADVSERDISAEDAEETVPRDIVDFVVDGFLPGGDPDGDPCPLTDVGLALDTSSTELFVERSATEHLVTGLVEPRCGLVELTVDGVPVNVDEEGRFAVSVPVSPGVRLVEIAAADIAGGTRCGDLALLVADSRPPGELAPGAGSALLTEALLHRLAEPARDALRPLRLFEGLVGSPEGCFRDGDCELCLASAVHAPPAVQLRAGGATGLSAEVSVRGIHLTLDGACDLPLVGSVPFEAWIDADYLSRSELLLPDGEGCVERFESGPAEVEISGFDVGADAEGILLSLALAVIAEVAEDRVFPDVSERIAERIEEEGLLDALAAMTFDATDEVPLGDVVATVSRCLTSLETDGERTTAVLGYAVDDDGTVEAPGAPLLETPRPEAEPGSLLVDVGLVGRVLHGAWRNGQMSVDGSDVPVDLVSLIAPGLREAFPDAEDVDLSFDARLPPLVTTAPEDVDRGDAIAQLGDLELVLAVDGQEVYRFRTHAAVTLELVPRDGALMPLVTDVWSSACLVEERVAPVQDGAFADVVRMQLPDILAVLLPLPPIPVAGGELDLTVTRVEPVSGTSFLRVGYAVE